MLGLAALGAEPLLHSPRESSRRGAHVLQPHTKARATRPHLIVTLVDDVGYNDVGWRNGDVKTPFLDSLLRSESEPTVELLRHYAFSVCSPTRAALLRTSAGEEGVMASLRQGTRRAATVVATVVQSCWQGLSLQRQRVASPLT